MSSNSYDDSMYLFFGGFIYSCLLPSLVCLSSFYACDFVSSYDYVLWQSVFNRFLCYWIYVELFMSELMETRSMIGDIYMYMIQDEIFFQS
jgi:hypothetical protein